MRWRVLALKGAELILLPSAGRSGWGRRINNKEQTKSLRSTLSVLLWVIGMNTRSNGVFAVFGSQVDYNGHSTHIGDAMIIDPFGEVLSKGQVSFRDHMIVADLNPKAIDKARLDPGYNLKYRRPEVYKELTRMI